MSAGGVSSEGWGGGHRVPPLRGPFVGEEVSPTGGGPGTPATVDGVEAAVPPREDTETAPVPEGNMLCDSNRTALVHLDSRVFWATMVTTAIRTSRRPPVRGPASVRPFAAGRPRGLGGCALRPSALTAVEWSVRRPLLTHWGSWPLVPWAGRTSVPNARRNGPLVTDRRLSLEKPSRVCAGVGALFDR
jgi:hypothetical protein